MADVSEFLNSKSMLTPGLAGGTVMMITNTLGVQFSIAPAATALGLSFVVGTLTLADRRTSAWQRVVFYLINPLIIFSIATGANAAGAGVVNRPLGSAFRTDASPPHDGFFRDWFRF